ncbi:MAG: SDR family NAD(P)-dependent oxidoreductase [Pseudomonadota bacterium]
MKLEGKVAAITGGTAGLGRGIAEAFMAEGAKVALFARNADKGARVLDELRVNRPGRDRAIFVAGDVMNQGNVEGFIDKTIDEFGTLDILVNNAGGAGDLQPMVDLSDEAFDEAMKWNVYSTFWATRRALPEMLKKGDGRVINMSSMEGKHGKPVFTAYTAAKHAVNGITKSLAREVGAQGVTVNSICPGLVVTDIIKNNGPATAKAMGMEFDEMITMFAQEAAIKRPNTVEEIAAVAMLLASKEGAGITGAMISVDGGTAQF